MTKDYSQNNKKTSEMGTGVPITLVFHFFGDKYLSSAVSP